MDKVNNFQTALKYASEKPDDPMSVELRSRIENGDYNEELQALGKPTFQNGEMVQPSLGDTIVNRAKQTYNHPIEAAKGFAKGVGKTALNLASDVQDIGQFALGEGESLITGKPLEETAAMQPGAGIDALKRETPENQALQDALAPSNEAQAGGQNLETGAEIYYGGGKDLLKGGAKLATEYGAPIVKDAIETVSNSPLAKKVGAKIAEKNLGKTIDAVNPDLSGKKLSEGYKEIVTKGRDAKESGVFSEQALSPSERAINLGNRLNKGIDLANGEKVNAITLSEKNPIKSLKTLKNEMVDTEAKLTSAMSSNEGITANKPALNTSFDDAIENAPEEFRIGDPSKMYGSVFKFAKKIADKADDSIAGLRNARSEFDAQARIQYPSAFKDGSIDTKTSAGSAIKKARDIFNEHLYNTAPNGSDLQKLIGREADIYQATESLAAKAAKSEGKTKIQKATEFLKDHPYITAGASLYGFYEGGKKLFGE